MDLFQDKLNTKVATAGDVNDLLPIIKCISIDKIKQFLHQNINEATMDLTKNMYFNSSSIDEIIPSDIIKHILSFQALNLEHVKRVNKQWNKLSNQNEKRYYSSLQQNLNQNSPIPYHKSDTLTWTLHPRRTRLTRVEKHLGFKMSATTRINQLGTYNARHKYVKSGDRFFLQPGIYPKINTGCLFDKNISIIVLAGKPPYYMKRKMVIDMLDLGTLIQSDVRQQVLFIIYLLQSDVRHHRLRIWILPNVGLYDTLDDIHSMWENDNVQSDCCCIT